MSIYTELLRIGVHDETAREITDACVRASAASGLVTLADLETRLAKLETAVIRANLTILLTMTGIFATFVGALAWVLAR